MQLPVVEAVVTQTVVGQPGEEDLFVFDAPSEAGYTIETSGPTDLVMTLLSDSSSLIGQGDDSGEGRNARIVAELAPGRYTVQVHHYNSAGGNRQLRDPRKQGIGLKDFRRNGYSERHGILGANCSKRIA